MTHSNASKTATHLIHYLVVAGQRQLVIELSVRYFYMRAGTLNGAIESFEPNYLVIHQRALFDRFYFDSVFENDARGKIFH